MLALLGQTVNIEKELQECQDQIEDLKVKIAEKQRGHDVHALKTYCKSKPLNVELKNARSERFSIRRRLVGHFGKLYALHWGNNSIDIVSASQDGKLLVWNVQTTNKRVAIPLRSAWVMTCAYSPEGTYVASGGLDNLCSIFNVKDSVGWEVRQPHRELQQHEGYLSCCRFVDDQTIITASGDASCIYWDIEKQRPIATFVEHTGDVESVAVYPQNHTFVSGGIDAMAKVWDYRTNNKCVANFKKHASDVNSVQWFPDGRAFISGSDDASCRLFDLRAYRQLAVYSDKELYCSITSVDFSKSGYYLIAGYDEDPYCIAWNTITAEKEFHLEHSTRASCLQVSPDGFGVATGCWDKTLRVWA